MPTGPAYLDPIGGYNAAAAILTALVYRQATGQGQYIEMSQVEAAMPFIGELILDSLETERRRQACTAIALRTRRRMTPILRLARMHGLRSASSSDRRMADGLPK